MGMSSFTKFYCPNNCHISHIFGVLQYSGKWRVHNSCQFEIIISGDGNILSYDQSAFGTFFVSCVCHAVIGTYHGFHMRKAVQEFIDLGMGIRRKVTISDPALIEGNMVFFHYIQDCLFTFISICNAFGTCEVSKVTISVIFYKVFCEHIHAVVIVADD